GRQRLRPRRGAPAGGALVRQAVPRRRPRAPRAEHAGRLTGARFRAGTMAARRLRHGSMIVLVRHGETEGNARRVMQLPDTPLSSVGLAQAERLAERLAGMGIAHILCSDLLRARMTALPIARRTGTQVEFSPLL